MSNIKHQIIAMSCVFVSLSGCNITMWPSKTITNPLNEATTVNGQATNQPVHIPDAFIVCRDKQCAPANLSMSSEYIYNSLVSLFQNNNHQTALVCEGSDSTHSCIETYISMPTTVGITPAYSYIDSVKISDVSINKGKKSINLLLNYNLTYNGQTPECTPARTLAYVKDAANIIMQDGGYTCKMTTISSTKVSSLFAVDYIDLDYGFIGGYYSIGLSGPAYGGGNGYMLIRLPRDAYPLSPQLQAPKNKKKASQEIIPESSITGEPEADNDVIYEGVQIFPIKK